MIKLRNIIMAGLSSLLLFTLSSCGDKVGQSQIADSILSIGLSSSSENIKSVPQKGDAFFIKVTTPNKWAISVEPESAKAWVKADAWAGSDAVSKKDIRFDILENSEDKERTAEIILTSESKYQKLIITQHGVKKDEPTPENPEPENPEPENPTPQAGVVFLETFGSPEKVEGKSYYPSVDKYTGWSVKTNKYSDPFFDGRYSKASARKTSSLDGHIWFASNKKSAFRIENFKTGTDLKLSFKLADNSGTLMANALKLSTDKGAIMLPATQLKKNEYQEFTVTLPDNVTFIQFEADNLTDGIRLDDIKLVAGKTTGGNDNPNTGGGTENPNTGGGTEEPNPEGGEVPAGEHIKGDVNLLELPKLAGGTNNYFVTLKTSNGDVNYSLEFDVDKRGTRWVAFQFNDKNSAKNVKRTEDWRWDSQYIPRSFSTETFYRGSGYSRGHLVASSDRLQSREANKQTFNYFNMAPQIQHGHNGGIWLDQERKVQSWGRNPSFRDVLYVAKGGTIKDGQIKSRKIKGIMVIPDYFFMAIVVKKGNQYHGIAFWTEHRAYPKHTSVRSTSISIDELEKKTGIDFFHNFPDELENKFEAETASSYNWPGL